MDQRLPKFNGSSRERFESLEWPSDALSLILFGLVADDLGRLLTRGVERGVIEGLRVGKENVRISHLQYADNAIFFYQEIGENS